MAWNESSKRAVFGSATLDFPSIAAVTAEELTIPVAAAEVGDVVYLGAPAALEANLMAMAYVSAAGVVTVRVANMTAGAIDPASATYKVAVQK